jgi:hypothetical protein
MHGKNMKCMLENLKERVYMRSLDIYRRIPSLTLEKTGCEDVERIELHQDMLQWCAFMITIMNF